MFFFYSRRSLLHQINQFVIDANDIKRFMLWNDCNDNIEQWWKHFGRWWLNDTFNSSNEPMKQNLWTEGSTFRLKANKFSFNSNAVIKLFEIFKFSNSYLGSFCLCPVIKLAFRFSYPFLDLRFLKNIKWWCVRINLLFPTVNSQ